MGLVARQNRRQLHRAKVRLPDPCTVRDRLTERGVDASIIDGHRIALAGHERGEKDAAAVLKTHEAHRAVVSAPLDCFGSGAAGIKAERDSELDADEISLGRLGRSELNSNCRYRFLNCQTTASCYNFRR
jgi:hypothetical protein